MTCPQDLAGQVTSVYSAVFFCFGVSMQGVIHKMNHCKAK